MENIINTLQQGGKEKGWYNVINPWRFNYLYGLTDDLWIAHVLDRLIYRCQNSKLSHRGQPTVTESLESLAKFVGTTIRGLRKNCYAIEKLGLISWETHFTQYGKQTFITLTPQLTEGLKHQIKCEAIARLKRDGEKVEKDSGASGKQFSFFNAENHYRYRALAPLLGTTSGRQTFFHQYVLSQIMTFIGQKARENSKPCHETAIHVTQSYLSCYCHVSLRNLQRYLAHLEKQEILLKTKRKVSATHVETRYQVAQRIWKAVKQADADRASTRDNPIAQKKHEDKIDLKTRKPSVNFGGSKQAENGECNISINKNLNINKKHSTVKLKQTGNVTRGTCQNNEHKSIVTLEHRKNKAPYKREMKLNTILDGETTLNKRQTRYLKGMLSQLQETHGCQFSDPAGLLDEITFAVKQIDTIFAGRRTFCHRVNLIAKLLRERRWTTPHGYERYDPKGKAQKARRVAREAAWKAEKADTARPDNARRIMPKRALILGQLLPNVGGFVSPQSDQVPAEITERLAMMQRLAERTKAPDCSDEARAGITALLQQHQAAIQEAMADHQIHAG